VPGILVSRGGVEDVARLLLSRFEEVLDLGRLGALCQGGNFGHVSQVLVVTKLTAIGVKLGLLSSKFDIECVNLRLEVVSMQRYHSK